MNLFKKAAVALAAVSMTVAPTAASAANASLRADTAVEGNSFGPAGMAWLPALIGLGLFGLGLVVFADGSDDTPTSP